MSDSLDEYVRLHRDRVLEVLDQFSAQLPSLRADVVSYRADRLVKMIELLRGFVGDWEISSQDVVRIRAVLDGVPRPSTVQAVIPPSRWECSTCHWTTESRHDAKLVNRSGCPNCGSKGTIDGPDWNN